MFTYSVGPNFSGKLALNVADDTGKTVCRMDVPETVGVNRATWNLRVDLPPDPNGRGGRGGGGGGGRGRANGVVPCIDPSVVPPAPNPGGPGAFGGGRGSASPLVPAGHYAATVGKLDGTTFAPIGKTQWFEVVPLPAKSW
jgi:hypothetical protein